MWGEGRPEGPFWTVWGGLGGKRKKERGDTNEERGKRTGKTRELTGG